MVGSPLKKQRASLSGQVEGDMLSRFGLGLLGAKGDVLGAIERDSAVNGNSVGPVAQDKRVLFGDAAGSVVQEKVAFGGQLETSRLETPQPEKVVKTEEMEEEL